MTNIDSNLIERIKVISKEMRIRAIKMAYNAGNNGAHLGGGLSAIELFAVLYHFVMKIDPNNPDSDSRDRLILSKGHAVLAYYTVLESMGFLTQNDLDQFETNGFFLHGHAAKNISKGIEFSGGSLGLGISFGVGVAIALKKRELKSHVYIIVGDGECDEGIVWEALMSASHFNLTNITVIVDHNKLQSDGPIQDIMNLSPLSEKFEAFGFYVQEVDGHNIKQLCNVFQTRNNNKPNVIISHTVKGKGVSFIENKKEWHHSKINQKQYEQAMEELQ
jgi:transketolase